MIEFHNVTKRFDDKLLYQDLSFTIPPGAIVGIVGGNGAGKSTLFKLVTGKEQPDAGEVVIGETVDIAYVEQLRDALDDKQTVWEAVSDGQDILNINGYEVSSRATLVALTSKATTSRSVWMSFPVVSVAACSLRKP